MADTAGSRWRLLVHVPNGVSHTVVPVASETPSTSEWAAEHVVPGEFDELVVGSAIHIEQMTDETWWMNVGGVTLHVDIDRDGRPTRVQVDGPGDYDDPVPGCAYAVTWTSEDTLSGETPPAG